MACDLCLDHTLYQDYMICVILSKRSRPCCHSGEHQRHFCNCIKECHLRALAPYKGQAAQEGCTPGHHPRALHQPISSVYSHCSQNGFQLCSAVCQPSGTAGRQVQLSCHYTQPRGSDSRCSAISPVHCCCCCHSCGGVLSGIG